MIDTKHNLCYIIDTTKQGNTYKEEIQNEVIKISKAGVRNNVQ